MLIRVHQERPKHKTQSGRRVDLKASKSKVQSPKHKQQKTGEEKAGSKKATWGTRKLKTKTNMEDIHGQT